MNRQRAFTLVEMLLVVAIIVLLISMLLPAMKHSGDRCRSNFHNLGEGMIFFAMDHQNRLPASSTGVWQGTEDWQKCWIGKEGRVPGRYEPTHVGTLVPYLGGETGAAQLYRCPNLKKGTIGAGDGSNGSFDYAMTLSFTGARITNLPTYARVQYLSDPMGPPIDPLRTPLLIEEDPKYHNNALSIEPGFGSIDRQASHHTGSSCNYLAVDGGVVNLPNDQPRPPQAWEWFARGKGGGEYRLNDYGVTYGYWRGK